MQGSGRYIRRALIAALLVLAAAAPSWAVGTVTLTSSSSSNGVIKYTFAWTSDAAGAVSGNAKAIAAGYVIQAQLTPGTGGVQPTDLYDVVLNDTNTVDWIQGSGANVSNVTTKLPTFHPPPFLDGTSTLDLVISNAGNAKSGTFILWIRP